MTSRFLFLTTVFFLGTSHAVYTHEAHYLFSPGTAAPQVSAVRYTHGGNGGKWLHGIRKHAPKGPIIMGRHYKTFSYKDSCGRLWNTNFAQEEDVATLNTAYQRLLKEKRAEQVVLVGVSRGAATAFGFLANNPTCIRAAVLESPFDSVDSALDKNVHRIFRAPQKRLSKTLNKQVLPRIFGRYRPDGPSPIEFVAQISHDMPILLVCSRKDTIVPMGSTIALYNKLRATGHNNAHLLILEQSMHGLVNRNSSDGILYRNVTHAFYKAYNLPHNDNWATAGETAFLKTQPVEV